MAELFHVDLAAHIGVLVSAGLFGAPGSFEL
ncbi:hypothetical protein CLV49_2024 [Labedella gwakjiensis]|uniref:Uncharacterized protein n=1 Tax=Labedella gwakjiensis TaxID=390269 RepID=A0A2P8GWS0_9MICO|nr:hypothetical protein CLV49_2024 [Labedella gwakjiensis]